MTATAMETSLENKHLGNGGYFRNYCFFLASFLVDRARCKWTGRSAVEQNIENERFTVLCPRCRLNLKFGNFTLSFGRLRQRIVLLFFLIQPIRSLFSGVVVVVAVNLA